MGCPHFPTNRRLQNPDQNVVIQIWTRNVVVFRFNNVVKVFRRGGLLQGILAGLADMAILGGALHRLLLFEGGGFLLLGHLPFDPIRPMHTKLAVPSLRHLLQYSLESLALGPILLGMYLLVPIVQCKMHAKLVVPSLRHLLQYILESLA